MTDEKETDLHVVRLILRDVIYLLLTEGKVDSMNREALVNHLDALNDMIGEDDYDAGKPDAS